MDESLQFWIAVTRIEGLGVRGAHKLIKHFGSPQAAYMASLTELESCGVPARVAQAIFAQAGVRDAERESQAIAKSECQLVAYDSEDYPPLLKQIPDAPLLLYVRGDVKVLSQLAMAMVGTRRPSAYGSSVAHRLAQDLAAAAIGVGQRAGAGHRFCRAPRSARGERKDRGGAGLRP